MLIRIDNLKTINMKKQKELQTVTMASSEMKESYVAPKTMSYSVQNEGMLCSSDPKVGGIVPDPADGGTAGFYTIGETNSIWD